MANNCPVCNSDDYVDIYVENEVPFFQNPVFDNEKEAKSVKCTNMHVSNCLQCGFIWNRAFELNNVMFDQNYENDQAHSIFFNDHLFKMKGLIENQINKNSRIIEIGCGQGTFLDMLSESGYTIKGYDPAYRGNNPNIIPEYYSFKDEKVDMIIMRQVLEYIPNFIHVLKLFSDSNPGTKIFIETRDTYNIIKNGAFWDLSNEYLNYFTLPVLRSIFKDCLSGYCFNGQYIYTIGELSNISSSLSYKQVDLNADLFQERLKECHKFVRENPGLFIWGAGAKGANFARVTDPDKIYIHGIIDINPKKQGKYIAKSGHKIFSPLEVIKKFDNPVPILIMNENYTEEIVQQLHNKPYKIYVLNNGIKRVNL